MTLLLKVFSALRIYGTWNRSWRPALPVLIVALVVPVSNIVCYIVYLKRRNDNCLPSINTEFPFQHRMLFGNHRCTAAGRTSH